MGRREDDEAAQAASKARADQDAVKKKQEIHDLAQVLGHDYGRRFVFRLLEECCTFESIWDASSRIHHKAGMQDVGHYLMAQIGQASPENLSAMIREAYTRKERETCFPL